MVVLSRRALLLGGGGVVVAGAGGGVLVDKGVLPGRETAYRVLGLNGGGLAIPDVDPGRRYDGTFDSEARGGASTAWSFVSPPDLKPRDLPLLVCLHGARADHDTAFTQLGIDRFLAQSVARGTPPFAVATVDGGPTSYWHPRADKSDASSMVTDELIPMLRSRFGVSNRLGLYGWSMGGYGALRLTMRGLEISAVAVSAPALFESWDDVAPGSFDDEDQFVVEGLRGDGADFPEVPLRVDCGKGDPFYFPVRDFVGDLPRQPEGGFEAGGHTFGYFRRMLPAQLAFIGEQLA